MALCDKICTFVTMKISGGHTPTAEEVKAWYAPLAENMLLAFPQPEDGIRYFKHFKVTREGRTFSRFTEIDKE